jgi:hypothetical protein
MSEPLPEAAAPPVPEPGMSRTAVAKAHCPIDDWDFDPRYTDGVCPICGWRPPGAPVEPPRLARVDWFWPTVFVSLVASVLMGILVLVAYSR